MAAMGRAVIDASCGIGRRAVRCDDEWTGGEPAVSGHATHRVFCHAPPPPAIPNAQPDRPPAGLASTRLWKPLTTGAGDRPVDPAVAPAPHSRGFGRFRP